MIPRNSILKPGLCAVCNHPDRDEINRVLGEHRMTQREVGALYGMSRQSVSGHFRKCIPVMMSTAQVAQKVDGGIVVQRALERNFAFVDKLIDACDEWLRDPEDNEKYTLNPRGNEIDVIYLDRKDTDDRGKPRRKKATLDTLISRIESGNIEVESVESKHADPRELILKSAAEIRGNLDFYAKIHGFYQKERSNQIDEAESKRFLVETVQEIMRDFGVDEKTALVWFVQGIPELSDFVAKYKM